jgi:hypothetical protein
MQSQDPHDLRCANSKNPSAIEQPWEEAAKGPAVAPESQDSNVLLATIESECAVHGTDKDVR